MTAGCASGLAAKKPMGKKKQLACSSHKYEK